MTIEEARYELYMGYADKHMHRHTGGDFWDKIRHRAGLASNAKTWIGHVKDGFIDDLLLEVIDLEAR